jgi:myo-inositol 2-dehydrogenase / D-chiro-inositol 1-dehydrogenase
MKGIGIIGAGVMGLDHARTLSRSVAGARIVAISDADDARAGAAAAEVGAQAMADGFALIARADVDAVIVAAPDHTHAPLSLACIAASKPVLCEKPLAPTPEEAMQVVEAERRAGRSLVQVGFMRRFDPHYRDLRATLRSGAIGAPALVHCAHRNVAAPSFFTGGMAVTNSAVHEFDILRWLLDDEIASIAVHAAGKAVPGAVPDPLLILLRMHGGVLAAVEITMNAAYGYDIRAEVVGKAGTATLARPMPAEIRASGSDQRGYPADWRPRFAESYRRELQSWVDGLTSGAFEGAEAWDGFVASAVAKAGLQALETGREVAVDMPARP